MMNTSQPVAPGRSLYQDAWVRVRRDPIAMVCLGIIVVYTLVALLAEIGWIFPDAGKPIGNGYEVKDLKPLTVVYAHELDAAEATTLPAGIGKHRQERDGRPIDYRVFRGRAAAVEHYYERLAAPVPEDLDELATAGLAEEWQRVDPPIAQWVSSLPAERRDAIVAAGPLVWGRIGVGGVPISQQARNSEQGAEAYYQNEDFGLDTADRNQLAPNIPDVWETIPRPVRGWIQTLPPAERRLLICSGPPAWRALAAAGLAADGVGVAATGEGMLPDNAAELWRQALQQTLAGRAPALPNWLYSLPLETRRKLLAGGVAAAASLKTSDMSLSKAELAAAGYWVVHTFILGSDTSGRDALALVVHGTKISMKVGLLASMIAIPIGLLLGALAGYFGRFIDDFIVWLYTTLACVPGLLLILAIAWAIGGGLKAIYIALGATTWVGLCRLIRGEFLKIREQDYVVAAKALGVGSWRIIRRHMIPNAMHLVIITFSLRFVYAILSEVVLSYIGIGVDPTQPSWGRLISDTQQDLASKGIWWIFTFTSLAMLFIVLAFNVFGDALRDALDPKLKGRS